MNRLSNAPATLLATAAALTMAATPAAAAELPVVNSAPAQVDTGAPHDAAGWGYGRRRHRGGVDAGDVIAGVLVIGAIAAIAGSANNRNRNRDRYEERETRNDSRRTDTRDYQSNNSRQSSGIDRAVDMCVDQVERGDDRVGNVDNASRTSDGWRVSGSLEQGAGWNCWIDNDGRIREVNLGDRYSQNSNSVRYEAASFGGEQLSDDAYARARAETRAATRESGRDESYTYASSDESYESYESDLESGAVPAYPGGPLPGEEGYDEAMGG